MPMSANIVSCGYAPDREPGRSPDRGLSPMGRVRHHGGHAPRHAPTPADRPPDFDLAAHLHCFRKTYYRPGPARELPGHLRAFAALCPFWPVVGGADPWLRLVAMGRRRTDRLAGRR